MREGDKFWYCTCTNLVVKVCPLCGAQFVLNAPLRSRSTNAFPSVCQGHTGMATRDASYCILMESINVTVKV